MNQKKILAREILIFFSGIVLVLLLWGIIAVRNTYYNHRIDVTNKAITAANDKFESDIRNGKLTPITDTATLTALENTPEIKSPDEIKIEKYRNRLINDDELQRILLITSIVFIGIVYILRFVWILIRWAIKTIAPSS